MASSTKTIVLQCLPCIARVRSVILVACADHGLFLSLVLYRIFLVVDSFTITSESASWPMNSTDLPTPITNHISARPLEACFAVTVYFIPPSRSKIVIDRSVHCNPGEHRGLFFFLGPPRGLLTPLAVVCPCSTITAHVVSIPMTTFQRSCSDGT